MALILCGSLLILALGDKGRALRRVAIESPSALAISSTTNLSFSIPIPKGVLRVAAALPSRANVFLLYLHLNSTSKFAGRMPVQNKTD